MGNWLTLNEEITACRACPRLVAWREEVAQVKRRAYLEWDYWGKPVPGFGDTAARLLIVGLAPGAHGSNRTGRMFTGDSSGASLYRALYEAGFANQPDAVSRDDGLRLQGAFITAMGRCAPPQNKPTREEFDNCRPFLYREWAMLSQIKVVVGLGHLAFDSCVRLLREHGYPMPPVKFGHGVAYRLEQGDHGAIDLLGCYHPSRQNTQTGRLTQAMLDEVFTRARALVG